MVWNIYTWFSLVFEIIIGGFAVATSIYLGILYKRDKPQLRKQIKSWKYGKFLWVYLIAFPLFIMSFAAEGQSAGYCIFKALTDAFKLMALQFDFDLSLVNLNVMYKAAIYTSYTVATLNVILFIVSCLNQIIWTAINTFKLKHCLSPKDIIIGNQQTSIDLYNSIPRKKDGKRHDKAIVDVITKDIKWDLFALGVHYVSDASSQRVKLFLEKIIVLFFNKIIKSENKINRLIRWRNKLEAKNINRKSKLYSNLVSWLNKRVYKIRSKKRLCIFINYGSDEANVEYCSFLSEIITALAKKSEYKDCLSYLDIYVFSSLQYKTIYESFINNLKGCLHLVDSEKILAYDFANRYPVALHMTKKHVDFITSTLHDDVNVTINFLGFGKTSQQLFLTLFSNTQFVKKTTDKIVISPVNFQIYDSKDKVADNKIFNESINKYFEWRKQNKDYFDTNNPNQPNDQKKYYPEAPMNNVKFNIGKDWDINSVNVKEEFYKSLENPNGKNINYIIVSLGSDFESIDIANRIYNELTSKPDKYKNCFIFMRIDENDKCHNTIKMNYLENKNTLLIGECSKEQKDAYSNYVNDSKNKVTGVHVEWTLKNNGTWKVSIQGPTEIVNTINKKVFDFNLDVQCKRFVYGSYYKTDDDNKEGTSINVVYDYEKIVPDILTKIAIMELDLYKANGNHNPYKQNCLILSKDKDIVDENRQAWTSADEFDRKANFHSALNLRSKLLLMGLDYVENDKHRKEQPFPNFELFWKFMSGNNPNDIPKLNPSANHNITVGRLWKKNDWETKQKLEIQLTEKHNNKSEILARLKEFKPIIEDVVVMIDDVPVEFNNFYGKLHIEPIYTYKNGTECLSLQYDGEVDVSQKFDSRRWVLVNMEHNRWSAFTISLGCVPRAIQTVKDTCLHKNKSIENACLTTMEGLVRLQKDLVENLPKFLEKRKNAEDLTDKEKLDNQYKKKNQNIWANKINFDYLQFDPAWHVLNRVGCKIIYSQNCPEELKLKTSEQK